MLASKVERSSRNSTFHPIRVLSRGQKANIWGKLGDFMGAIDGECVGRKSSEGSYGRGLRKEPRDNSCEWGECDSRETRVEEAPSVIEDLFADTSVTADIRNAEAGHKRRWPALLVFFEFELVAHAGLRSLAHASR